MATLEKPHVGFQPTAFTEVIVRAKFNQQMCEGATESHLTSLPASSGGGELSCSAEPYPNGNDESVKEWLMF